MSRVFKLGIGSKLIAAFTALIVGFGILLFGSLERFANLQESEAQQFQQHYSRLADVKDLRLNIAAQRTDMMEVIDEDSQANLQGIEDGIRERTRRTTAWPSACARRRARTRRSAMRSRKCSQCARPWRRAGRSNWSGSAPATSRPRGS
ncbi:hypothetical protein I0E98_16420 [Pseudomonas lalucatii]|nr:hypothetical protein [Pseudomonas lalucatii]